MIDLIIILFFILTIVPVAALAALGSLIYFFGKKHRNVDHGVSSKEKNFQDHSPSVSIVVATHNESKIISKKIESCLSSNYPLDKIELIFTDDSDDDTTDIISKSAEKFSNVKLLRFNTRMGYSPCMLAGCKAAKGEIIILNDAGSFLDPSAIQKIVDRLRNPEIGVVSGRDVIVNVNEEVGKSEGVYQKLYDFLRTSETNMDSTFYIKGEATGIRASILKNLEASSETFDTTIGLVARQNGFKVVYDPEVFFNEYAPGTHSGRIKQKTIRAANLIKVIWKFKPMMFKSKYGLYGSVILPYNFALLTLLPIWAVAWLISLIAVTIIDFGLAIFFWATIGVGLLLILAFSRRLLLNCSELEYSLLRAIYQIVFVRKEHDKIDKVESTRRITP